MIPASAPLRLLRPMPAAFRRTASFTPSAFRREKKDASNPGKYLVERKTEPLPYFVHRTENNNFPVYQEYKAGGGNKLQTRIRKVEGNLQFLRDQIEDAFRMEKGQVKINSLTGHVIVKGRRRDEIIRLLSDLGF
ncbi:mitochondrial large subunit ribosomal protein-domain-containing protein [Tuber brumale]|nr:mitochondrial large subunit ribosomal protein-domain-containing protein [Tuber brumale]